MDGKLDYQEGTVLMNHPANSVYQQVSSRSSLLNRQKWQKAILFIRVLLNLTCGVIQVIERTKGSFFRTSVLRYVIFSALS